MVGGNYVFRTFEYIIDVIQSIWTNAVLVFRYFDWKLLRLRFLRNLVVLGLLCTASSCIQLKGSYLPLGGDVKNPYNQIAMVREYNPVLKDTIEYVLVDQVQFPSARPYRDTVKFLSGKRVKAWSRPNTVSSCSMRVSKMEELEYTLRKDTLISNHVCYLVRGDTLYPLHHGAIYVKEWQTASKKWVNSVLL